MHVSREQYRVQAFNVSLIATFSLYGYNYLPLLLNLQPVLYLPVTYDALYLPVTYDALYLPVTCDALYLSVTYDAL